MPFSRGSRLGKPVPGHRHRAWIGLLFPVLLVLASWRPSPPAPSLSGDFLVAVCEMGDPRFSQAVIYMVQHDSEGAMGLIINRPAGEVPLDEFLKGLELDPAGSGLQLRVYYGGPVEVHRGFVLHSPDVLEESSQVLEEGVALTLDASILRKIAQGRGPRHYVMALGYAGWAPGQLESELARGSWFTAEADPASIFSGEPEKLWEHLVERYIFRL